MDIDICQIGVQLDVDDRDGEAPHHELTAVAIEDGPVEQKVFDIAAIDEDGDVVAVGPGQLGQADIARDLKIQVFRMDFHHLLGRPNTIDSSDSLAKVASSCCLHQGPVLVDQVKGDFWMGQAEAVDQVDDMGKLGLLALDVFEAGRRVVKEIFYHYLGSNWQTDGFFLYDFPPMGQ